MPTQSIITTNQGTLALLRDLVPRRRLHNHEVRHVAEMQAFRLRQLLGIDEAAFPSEAIEALPRVRVEYDADLPSSGMTFWDGRDWVIVLNATESETRQRFSLLHEFKHIIDHTTKEWLYGPEASTRSPAAERAADYFAACVLMPKLYVKRHWGQGPRTVSAMARRFEVSPQAMKYRLSQLQLLDEPSRRCVWSPSTYQRLRSRTLEVAA